MDAALIASLEKLGSVGRVAPESPLLLDWLRHANIHAQTPDDVRQAVSDVVPEHQPEPTVAAVRAEIVDLALVS